MRTDKGLLGEPVFLPDKRFWYYETDAYIEIVVTAQNAFMALQRKPSGFFIKIPKRTLKASLKRMG